MTTKFQELITETEIRRLTEQLPGRIGTVVPQGKTQLFLAILRSGDERRPRPSNSQTWIPDGGQIEGWPHLAVKTTLKKS